MNIIQRIFNKNKKGNVHFGGVFEIEVFDKNGKRKYHSIFPNILTNVGIAAVASRISGDGAEAVFNYLAVGTGTTAAAATDTALVTEVTTGGLARTTAVVPRSTTTIADDTAEYSVIFTSTTFAGTIAELGIFNAATAGTLLARGLASPAVALIAGDTLVGKYSVTGAAI